MINRLERESRRGKLLDGKELRAGSENGRLDAMNYRESTALFRARRGHHPPPLGYGTITKTLDFAASNEGRGWEIGYLQPAGLRSSAGKEMN